MYDTAIARAGDRATWLLWLQKGGALEQAGDWENARPALEKALELAPNEPIVLNYLGYASLEHGGDPGQALHRKSAVCGRRVSVGVEPGGRRTSKKHTK